MSFQNLVEEIMATHHSLLKRELPKISALFEKLMEQLPDNEELLEAKQIFSKVRGKVEVHLKDEESVLFPNGIAMEQGKAKAPTELDEVERLSEMEQEHENCSNTLNKVQKILQSAVTNSKLRDELLVKIQTIQDDFVVHVEKENTRVHPMLLELLAKSSKD